MKVALGSFASKAADEARLHGLDTLRAAAILWVMPYHLANHLPDGLQAFAHAGWMGVDLFFVLSGYLIGSQMFRPYVRGGTLSVGEFYRRRAYRILPVFFVVLALYVFVPAWRETPGLQPWWQFATFTENFLIDYRHNQAFSHAWSLCVEEHFYLLLPAITIVMMRRPAAWKTFAAIGAVLVLGVAMRGFVLLHVLRPMGAESDGFVVTYLQRMYYPTYVRLDGLLAGVALAAMRTFRPQWWTVLARRGHILALSGVGLAVLAGWLFADRFRAVSGRALWGDLFGYPLLGIGFALLAASAMSDNGLLARVRVPGARWISALAFSLYLTHKEAVHLLFLAFPNLPDDGYSMIPVYLGVCVCVAAVLYYGVERPFLRLREARQSGVVRPVASHRLDLEARVDPAL